METLEGPLNRAQLELLKLFSRVSDEKELNDIRDIVAQYYVKKAVVEANRLWDERGYTQQTMDDWMKEPT